jgi:hypothetical protein
MELSALSSFIAYNLTEVEHRSAYTYNEAQIVGIQNQIAAAAEEFMRINLDEDDTSLTAVKRKAYLKGQIAALKYLLSLHDTFNTTIVPSDTGN